MVIPNQKPNQLRTVLIALLARLVTPSIIVLVIEETPFRTVPRMDSMTRSLTLLM